MKIALLTLLSGLLLCGCETVTTRELAADIDPTLEQNSFSYPIIRAKTLSADGQLNVSAGPYRVSNMSTGWSTTTSRMAAGINLLFDAIEQEDYRFRQKLEFTFEDVETGSWEGLCEIRSSGSLMSIAIGDRNALALQNEYSLAYRCGFLQNGLLWNLVLDRRGGRDVQAYVSSAEGRRWELDAFSQDNTFQSEHPLNIFLGYYLLEDGRPVGAVSMLDDGEFWLHREFETYERSGLAIAALGLWFSNNAFNAPVSDGF